MSFQTPLTCELEYWKLVFPFWRWHFSYANESQKEKQYGDNADAVLWFYGFGKRNYLNKKWGSTTIESDPRYIYFLKSFVFSDENYMISSVLSVQLASHKYSTLIVYKTKLMVGVPSLTHVPIDI